MDTNGWFLIVFVGFMLLLAIIILTTIGIASLSWKIKERKFAKKFPKYCECLKIYNEQSRNHTAWHNENIPPIKKKIDELELSKKYLPQNEVKKVNEEIERLKEDLFELNKEDNMRHKELKIFWDAMESAAKEEGYLGFFQK